MHSYVSGYLSAVRPQSSAAVGSVLLFLCFAGAAVCISISAAISDDIGLEYFFVLLAGICAATCLWSTVDILRKSL